MKSGKCQAVLGLALLLTAVSGCQEKPRVELPLPTTPPPQASLPIPGLVKEEKSRPVVHVPPVPTVPYEEGYKAGFTLGTQQAVPKVPIPERAAVEEIAERQFGIDPENTDRWKRGFVEGYTDGFRNVVTGQK